MLLFILLTPVSACCPRQCRWTSLCLQRWLNSYSCRRRELWPVICGVVITKMQSATRVVCWRPSVMTGGH